MKEWLFGKQHQLIYPFNLYKAACTSLTFWVGGNILKTSSLNLSRVRRQFRQTDRQTNFFSKRHLKKLFTSPSFFPTIQKHKFRNKKRLKPYCDGPTNGPTDGPTDGRTNRPTKKWVTESRSTRLKKRGCTGKGRVVFGHGWDGAFCNREMRKTRPDTRLPKSRLKSKK